MEVKTAEFETKRHIKRVSQFLNDVIVELKNRSLRHDQSKLNSPELEVFEIYTGKLKNTTYGSDEYNQFLKEMKPALDHHYHCNSHHPEHFVDGIKNMNLLDLVEMLCDWLAASERHADGNIFESIKINQKRFGYDDILSGIFKNTVSTLIEV